VLTGLGRLELENERENPEGKKVLKKEETKESELKLTIYQRSSLNQTAGGPIRASDC
jgi:hypothetical protein